MTDATGGTPLIEPVALSGPMARNFAVLAGGRAVAWALQLTAFAVTAAYLGPGRFGTYAFAIAFAGLFGISSDLVAREIVTREAGRHPDREASLLSNGLYLRFVMGVGGYALMATTAVIAYDSEHLRPILIAGLAMVFASLHVFQTALELRLRLGWSALAGIADAAIALVGTLLLVRRDAGVLPFVWLYVGVSAVNAIVVAGAGIRLSRPQWRPSPHLWRELTRASAPLALANLFIIFYWRLDIVVLQALDSDAAVGQYGAGYKLLERALAASTLVLPVLVPVLARSFGQVGPDLRRRYRRAIHLTSFLVLPAAVTGAMTAWRVLPEVPGLEDYRGAGAVVSLLSPALFFITVSTVVHAALILGGLQRRLVAITATAALVNVVLVVALIPPFSYRGAAIATTVTEAAVMVMSLRIVARSLDLPWSSSALSRTAVATFILALALVPGYLVHPFVQVVAGVIVYSVAVAALGAIRRDELAAFWKRAIPEP